MSNHWAQLHFVGLLLRKLIAARVAQLLFPAYPHRQQPCRALKLEPCVYTGVLLGCGSSNREWIRHEQCHFLEADNGRAGVVRVLSPIGEYSLP